MYGSRPSRGTLFARKPWHSILLAALFCAAAAAQPSAEPLIAHARTREKAGDAATASELYAAWLAANPGASGAAAVFSAWFREEQDFPRLVDLSLWFLDTAKGVPGAAVQFLRIARLLDVSTRSEEAARAYVSAYKEGGPPSALLSAFLLSLEMNDLPGMKTALAQLNGKGGAAELLLGALRALQTGDDAAAQATLVGLAEQTGEPDLAMKSIWILYQRSKARGDDVGQAAARSRLAARFPDSPEAALATGVPADSGHLQVVLSPSPLPDLYSLQGAPLPAAEAVETPGLAAPPAPAGPSPGATQATAEPASPANPVTATAASTNPGVTVPATTAIPLYSVQAGAFQMQENADDLVGELKRYGLTPTIIQEKAQGKERYRVMAATGQSADDARALLQKLDKLGYHGFMIADK